MFSNVVSICSIGIAISALLIAINQYIKQNSEHKRQATINNINSILTQVDEANDPKIRNNPRAETIIGNLRAYIDDLKATHLMKYSEIKWLPINVVVAIFTLIYIGIIWLAYLNEYWHKALSPIIFRNYGYTLLWVLLAVFTFHTIFLFIYLLLTRMVARKLRDITEKSEEKRLDLEMAISMSDDVEMARNVIDSADG